MSLKPQKNKLWMLAAMSLCTVAGGALMLYIADQVKMQAEPLRSLDMLFIAISNLCGVMTISLGGAFLTLFLLALALAYRKESLNVDKEEAKPQ